jgi:hypothetical protein
MQRGAGTTLRRRSVAALKNCTITPVENPRLYSFEVSISWPHMGSEYRVRLFSKLQSKAWPNPSSLLSTLAEILTFLHESRALRTFALESYEEQRRLSSEKTSLAYDLQNANDARLAANARAEMAENEAIRLRKALLEKEKDMEDILADDYRTKAADQIQRLQKENEQLAAELALATGKIDELERESLEHVQRMQKLKAGAFEREESARKAYAESLEFLQLDCEAKLRDLDERCTELEETLRLEKLISSQLRAKLSIATEHVIGEEHSLIAALERAESVMEVLSHTFKCCLDSKREAEQAVDSALQKKLVHAANSKYARGGAQILSFVHGAHLGTSADSFLGRPYLLCRSGDDEELVNLMRKEFSADTAVVSNKYGGIESTLNMEWQIAVQPSPDVRYPGLQGKIDPKSGQAFPGRVLKKIETFMKHEMALKANLTRSEIIALRIWTGAAHDVLNAALRESLVSESVSSSISHPLSRVPANTSSPFLTTVTVFNSAITKLTNASEAPIQR